MKRNSVILIGTLALLMWACEKEIKIHTGFFSPIYKDSEEITILEITSNMNSLNLTGKINLSEGVIEIKLLNPDNKALHAFRIHSNDLGSIYEPFALNPDYGN